MTAVHATTRDALPGRLLVPTTRSDLTVTWHADKDVFVVSLWHGEECVASAPLDAAAAGDLAAYLVQHVSRRPTWGPRPVVSAPPRTPRLTDAVASALRRIGRYLAFVKAR